MAELEGEVAEGVAEDEDEVGDVGDGDLVVWGFAGEVAGGWFAGGGVVFAEEVDGGAAGDDVVDGDEEDGGYAEIDCEFHEVFVC